MSDPISTPVGITDETPELDPATFDLNAWIGGLSGTVRAVTLYQRSDLIGVIDQLQRELRVAELVSDDDRGMNDSTPDTIRRQIEETAREFEASGVVFKVRGQSDEANDAIKKRLKKKGITDNTEVILHQLLEAIIEPKGVTIDLLHQLQEKSEPQLKMLLTSAALASYQPPKVDVPFSSGSSASRRRERSS